MNEKTKQLIEEVKQMRLLQKEFFSKNRKATTLAAAMEKERVVDQLIKEIEAPASQPSMFQEDRLH